MLFNDLTKEQQMASNSIESIFLKHPGLRKKDFVMALSFLINKHKK